MTNIEAIEERLAMATQGEWQLFSIASSAGVSYRLYSEVAGRSIDIAHIPKEWSRDGRDADLLASAPADIAFLLSARQTALDHLGAVLFLLADLHPDNRCEALNEALAFYNGARPEWRIESSGPATRLLPAATLELANSPGPANE